MQIASFIIPGVPVAKGRPRLTTRGGHARAFTPDKTRRFEAVVADAARRAMDALDPCAEAVEVEAYFTLPIPKSWPKWRQRDALAGAERPTGKPDLDNYLKALADGMNGLVYVDDCQIVSARLSKRYGEDVGIAVTVRVA